MGPRPTKSIIRVEMVEGQRVVKYEDMTDSQLLTHAINQSGDAMMWASALCERNEKRQAEIFELKSDLSELKMLIGALLDKMDSKSV